MNICVEVSSLNNINDILSIKNVNYITLSLKDLSFNDNVLNKEDLNSIIEKIISYNKKPCLDLECLYNDDSLLEIKKILSNIDLDNIEYIFLSDFGLYELLTELNISSKAVFRASTYLTNTKDIYEYLQIFNKVCVSSEISSKELIQIINNIDNNKIMIDAFGQNVIFYSRRCLLTNYFIHEHINNDPYLDNYSLVEEKRDVPYPVKENKMGCKIYEPFHYYLSDELYESSFNGTIILHLNGLSDIDSLNIIKYYNEYIDTLNLDKLNNNINSNLKNVYKGAYGIESVLLKKEVTDE